MAIGASGLLVPLILLSGCWEVSQSQATQCSQRYLKLFPSSGLGKASFWLSNASKANVDKPIAGLHADGNRGMIDALAKLLSPEKSGQVVTFDATGTYRNLIEFGCAHETDNEKLYRVVLRDRTSGAIFDVEADPFAGI